MIFLGSASKAGQKYQNIQRRFAALMFWLLASAAYAQDCSHAEKLHAEYLKGRTCETAEATGCLEAVISHETASVPVFYWRDGTEIWASNREQASKHYLPHFLLVYLHHLRKIYAACGSSREPLVWAQVQAIIGEAKLRQQTPGSMPSLAWENRYGYAQGMEQAEIAAYLASLAAVYQKYGESGKALSLMRSALQLIEALAIPIDVNNGGVRSRVAKPCGSGQNQASSCFWFHSRGLGVDTANEEAIPTVLNQHLHVIYDVLLLYKTIHNGGVPVPPEYGSRAQLLVRLEGYAAGGLGQLAYGRGNSASNPDAPPNMAQFLNRRQSDTRPHYLAYYRFDMANHKGKNIRWKNVCHYHTHVLTKLAHIKTLLDKHPEVFRSTPSGQGQLLYAALESLFSGAGEPMGLVDTKAPVWQLWLAHRAKYTLAGCPACDGTACSPEDAHVDAYYSTLDWIH